MDDGSRSWLVGLSHVRHQHPDVPFKYQFEVDKHGWIASEECDDLLPPSRAPYLQKHVITKRACLDRDAPRSRPNLGKVSIVSRETSLTLH